MRRGLSSVVDNERRLGHRAVVMTPATAGLGLATAGLGLATAGPLGASGTHRGVDAE